MSDLHNRKTNVPTFDALRLAVQWRLNQDQLDVLSLVTGITKPTLEIFAETGEISDRDRMVLEVYQ